MNRLVDYSWLIGLSGFMCLFAAAALFFVEGQLDTLGIVLAGSSALLLVAYAALDREALGQAATSRGVIASSGGLLVVLVGFFLAGIIQQVVLRYDQRVDFTRVGRFSLSTHTQAVVDGLAEDVAIYGLFPAGHPDGRAFAQLVEGYTLRSGAITYQAIDPLLQPVKAVEVARVGDELELGRLSEFGTVVLATGTQRRRLESRFDEEALTNGLIQLTSGDTHDICWAIDHGERGFADEGPRGYSSTVNRMLDQNYEVQPVRNLTGELLRACDALVIASPSTDWLPSEREALAVYLGEGGRAVLLFDGMIEAPEVPELQAEMARYGLEVGTDLIMEQAPENVGFGPADQLLALYYGPHFTKHAITDAIVGRVGFHVARSVGVGDAMQGILAQELIRSSPQSWAETDAQLSGDAPPMPDAHERVGGVPMMAVVEIADPDVLGVGWSAVDAGDTDALPAPPVRSPVPNDYAPQVGGRLVVFGDASFADNRNGPLESNGDLFLDTLAWLVGESDQLGERPAPESELLRMSSREAGILALVSVVLLPAWAFLLALVQWVRRRTL